MNKSKSTLHGAEAVPSITRAVVSAPKRTFAFSATLGNVTVNIFLPGMESKVRVLNVVKKQHTLLPQHRPPLRRDKPVRVSIPDQAPRYIFPSTERSFIFIPRALRPNQQTYIRGRGRGSFHGSRRTSVFGGSTYSHSVAMSRKSSVGGGAPTDYPRQISEPAAQSYIPGTFNGRPVVRMPTSGYVSLQQAFDNGKSATEGCDSARPVSFQGPTTVQVPPDDMTMHQPRPQKAVSIAHIESPASLDVKAPKQQQEQPFHQQVPVQVGAPRQDELMMRTLPQQYSGLPSNNSLSHIPERAIYARPFQPFPIPPSSGYFGAPAQPTPVYYPSMGNNTLAFGMPMLNPAVAPHFIPGAGMPNLPFTQAHISGANLAQNEPSAHVPNGMVYYYDSSQIHPNSYLFTPLGQVVDPNGVAAPHTHFYYPSVPNGMYAPLHTG